MLRHLIFTTLLLALAATSCKDDQVGVSQKSPNPAPSDPSAETPAPSDGVNCEGLFASHGHCFVSSKEKIYNVPVGTSPTKGAKTPLVTIVEFTDFQCPACQRFTNERIPELLKKYGQELAVVFKHYPLSFHPKALTMSLAAEEVRAQKGDKAFWKFHDVMFRGAPSGPVSAAWIRSEAEKAGLNMADYDKAMKSGKHKKTIQRDMALGKKVGLEGTPWIFVNGRLSRKKSVETLITETLAEAKKAVADGTPRDKIYSFITDHGEPLFVKNLPKAEHQKMLTAFKPDFMKKCTKQAKDFKSFYGYMASCAQSLKKCKPFLKCIEEKVYQK